MVKGVTLKAISRKGASGNKEIIPSATLLDTILKPVSVRDCKGVGCIGVGIIGSELEVW